MAKHKMADGTIINTANAQQSWDEAKIEIGGNQVSKATGQQWFHERLYQSAKGRYYVFRFSMFDNEPDYYDYITNEEAARWLLNNEHELPEELETYAAAIEE